MQYNLQYTAKLTVNNVAKITAVQARVFTEDNRGRREYINSILSVIDFTTTLIK